MNKFFGTLFILTGIFAIVGGLYTWGDGNIFKQNELIKVLIPFADIIVTGPLSIVCGIGLLKKKYWGNTLGLSSSGIYIFGSVLVFTSVIWNKDFSIYLLLPATSGLIIGTAFLYLSLTQKRT
jgi:hypothetical protein